MKKVLSILVVLSCLFLVSCKEDKIVKVKEETEPMQEKISKIEYIDKNEDIKNQIVKILYSQDIEGIKRDLKFIACPIKIKLQKMEISDEIKELQCKNFFKNCFPEDIKTQEKLKHLPLDYRYAIYQKLKQDSNLENDLKVLQLQNIEEIKEYFKFTACPIKVQLKEVEIIDELKEMICNTFFENYFLENIEIQEKIKQIPLDYRYAIYEKLK